MMLGLGLGLNKNNFISSVDPIIDALIKANCTMYLDPNKADGTSKGINSPLTNPLTDLIGSNDATLVNFNGTVSSGYDDLTLPNTNVKTFLKADGVDDYGTIANNASIDPTGTEDFAYCKIFKTIPTNPTSYLLNKSNGSTGTMQYGFFVASNQSFGSYIGGGFIGLATVGTISDDEIHCIIVKRIGSVLKCEIDGIETYNAVNTRSLTSGSLVRTNAKPTNAGGTTHDSFSAMYGGAEAFFYNGATGLNETDVDDACALLKADYF